MTDKPKKKKKPLTATPVYRITAALRRIWMWSPERAAIVKRADKHCEECSCECATTKKQEEKTGKPLLEIHHVIPCDLTELAKLVHRRLFPGEYLGLCQSCHVEAEEQIKLRKGE